VPDFPRATTLLAKITKRGLELDAQKLVDEGERSYPGDLKTARQKAEQANGKVPDYAPAKTLLAKVEARQQIENQVAARLKDASDALENNDTRAAERALEGVPADYRGRDEYITLKQDIAKKKKAAKPGSGGGRPVSQKTTKPPPISKPSKQPPTEVSNPTPITKPAKPQATPQVMPKRPTPPKPISIIPGSG
jgi:hypothetical protein